MPNPSLSIFLCYAKDQHALAEEIYHALIAADHRVYFDRRSISTSSEHHAAISAAIDMADIAVFLISPGSVEDGAYTRSELRYMSEKWPNPEGKLVSVLPQHSTVTLTQVPPYAKAVSILRPEGNAVAEVVAAVKRLATILRPKYRLNAEEINAIETAFARLDKEWEKDAVPTTPDSLKGIGCVSVVVLVVFAYTFGIANEVAKTGSGWSFLLPATAALIGLAIIGKQFHSLRKGSVARATYLHNRKALRERCDVWFKENIGE